MDKAKDKDCRQTVEQIRFFLQSNDQSDMQTMAESLRGLNIDYSMCCATANDRLRRVREFLQRGLRAEAIHVAEEDPPLLELVALLDFPERPDWNQFCQTYNLGPMPPILLDVANELAEAYAAADPLKDLLRRHRRLALERAPMRERLAVLRQIAALDGESDFWPDDVRAYEEHRHRELESDLRQLSAAKDLASLKALMKELKAPEWQSPPSADFVKRTQAALKKLEQEEALRKLRETAPQLVAACQQANVFEGRRLRSLFDQLAAESGVSGQDPVYDLVGPSMEWLTQVDLQEQSYRRFLDAVQQFEEALGDPHQADETHLNRLIGELGGYGFPLPDGLAERHQQKIASLRGAVKRQKMTTWIASGSILAVLVGLIAVFVVGQLRAGSLKSELAAIDAQLKDRNHEEAGTLIESLRNSRPSVASDSRFQELETQWRTMRDTETDRVARFEAKLRNLKKDLGIKKFPTDPELKELESLALTPAEKTQVVDFRGDVERAKNGKGSADASLYAASLDTVQKKIGDAEQELNAGNREAASRFRNEAASRISELKQTSSSAATADAERTTAMEARLQSLTERLEKSRTVDEFSRSLAAAFATLTKNPTAANVDAFTARVSEFLKDNPTSPRSDDFRKAVSESSHWKAALEWNELMRKARDYEQLTVPSAKNRVQECDKFLSAHPNFAEKTLVDRFRRIATAVTNRSIDTDTTARRRLELFLSDPGHSDVLMLETKSGGRHYFKQEPKFGSAPARVETLSDFGGVTSVRTIDPADLVTTKAAPAPHSEAAKEALKILRGASDAQWDDALRDIAILIDSRKAIDPLLRLRMLKTILDIGATGSVPFGKAVEPQRQAISSEPIDIKARWMNPDDALANSQRPLAAAFLNDSKKFPPLSQMDQAIKTARAEEKAALSLRYDIAGWLQKSADGKWQCESAPGRLAAIKTARLQTLSSAPGSTASLFRDAGNLVDGVAAIHQEAGSTTLVEGRIVFARIEK